MHFALVNSERTPAAPGLSGVCPVCGKAMVARCGQQRVWHWAHRVGRACDTWWENESPWHRAWKDRFPTSWQEVVHGGSGEERHIADVRTPHGLVIEFQRSHLPPDEQRAREAFYDNMLWVVDGTRLKGDLPRFLAGKDYFHSSHLYTILIDSMSGRAFPKAWLRSSVLVALDFVGGRGDDTESDGIVEDLWCLFPGRVAGRALVAPLPRNELVRMAHEQSFIFEVDEITKLMKNYFRKEAQERWFGRPPYIVP